MVSKYNGPIFSYARKTASASAIKTGAGVVSNVIVTWNTNASGCAVDVLDGTTYWGGTKVIGASLIYTTGANIPYIIPLNVGFSTGLSLGIYGQVSEVVVTYV